MVTSTEKKEEERGGSEREDGEREGGEDKLKFSSQRNSWRRAGHRLLDLETKGKECTYAIDFQMIRRNVLIPGARRAEDTARKELWSPGSPQSPEFRADE